MAAAVIFPLCTASIIAAADGPSAEMEMGERLPTGKSITPTAAQGAIFQDLDPRHAEASSVRASGASAIAVSPDGARLAVLTSGFNKFHDTKGATSPVLSSEYLFIYDISGGKSVQQQVLPLRATFLGLSWTPSSDAIFVSAGVDDAVREFVRRGDRFVPGRVISLGHTSWIGPNIDLWDTPSGGRCAGCTGEAAGLEVSPDGTRLLVANMLNDSVSLIDLRSGQVTTEKDLRPGLNDPRLHGHPGGSYPRAIAWISPRQAFVASERDREVIGLAVGPRAIRIAYRIPVKGQPVALAANRSGSRLYVALDTSDKVAVIDTASGKVIELLDVVAPPVVFSNGRSLAGANTNALALAPDQTALLVSNGGENALAVVRLGWVAQGTGSLRRGEGGGVAERSEVVGLVPTGWYPTGVAVGKDGRTWYVISAKSPTGPNVSWCRQTDPATNLCRSESPALDPRHINDFEVLETANEHTEQLEKAGLLSLPRPEPSDLARLTKQVAQNNHLEGHAGSEADQNLFSFLRQHIKHVVYIMKENRSYDQILGDLEVGNGDRRLALFPDRITPNQHQIARSFVTLDNTLVSGEGSLQGFQWTVSAQTTDHNERNEPLTYVDRGAWDAYGNNRTINTSYATSRERAKELSISPPDPDILPGAHDVNAPDGPDSMDGKGYIWDAALSKGLTVRNWGFAPDATWMFGLFDKRMPVAYQVREPFKEHTRVFWTANASLRPFSDPYYRTFFFGYPDFWREREWEREFADFSAKNSAPALMLMWLGGDHMGHFDIALDGVNTPETQVADNDYALGRIVEAVSKSPFAKDTLIAVIEDDAWDGADHVDSHRTVALFAGPYVRQHAVVSTRYTTVSVVKTIEEILGIGPIGLNDAFAAPMSDVFDPSLTTWTYKVMVPDVLRSTKLPLPPADHASNAVPRWPAEYWTKAMAGQDFSGPDRIEPVSFNRALWRGLKGDIPYSVAREPRSLHRPSPLGDGLYSFLDEIQGRRSWNTAVRGIFTERAGSCAGPE